MAYSEVVSDCSKLNSDVIMIESDNQTRGLIRLLTDGRFNHD